MVNNPNATQAARNGQAELEPATVLPESTSTMRPNSTGSANCETARSRLANASNQPRRVDAAKAVAPDLVGQDVVGEHRAQARELEVAVAVVDAAGGLVSCARWLLRRCVDARNQRADKTLQRVRLRLGEGGIGDDG